MYKIVKVPYFYEPDIQGRNVPRVLPNDYETLEHAREAVDERNVDTYYLNHGEYSRPDYIIVDDPTAYYIESGRYRDMSNYDWSEYPGKCGDCGECGECNRWMIGLDREYTYNHAVK